MEKLKAKQYERNIATQCEIYQKIYGANKNLYRHIASMDGLKPVQRRILYTMFSNPSFPLQKFSKVSSICSATAMQYHPHGDATMGEVVYGMGQPWANNIPLIEKYGNFGTVDGERPAAPRYTEAKISQFALDCYFKDFDKRYIDMKESYNGRDEEPEYLPTRYPVALLNGIYGSIGYGLCSNIPPYNFTELCEAAIKLAKNPKAKTYLVPDSPTGCDVYDDTFAKESYNTGFGKITYQASYTIDYEKNMVTFLSMPPTVSLRAADERVSKLKLDGKFDNLIDKRNETNKMNGLLYKLYFKPEANVDEELKKLFKTNAGFKQTEPTGIVLIDDYKAMEFSVPEFLLAWLEKRREQIRSQYNMKFVNTMSDIHMNDIKLFVFGKDNLEKTIEMAKKAPNKAAYKDALVNAYNITYIQAEVIANMRTVDFNKDAYESFKALKKSLKEELERIKSILKDKDAVNEIIIEQLKEGIKKYGAPRRSKIIYGSGNAKVVEECVIGVSTDGFIKRIPADKKAIGKITKASGTKTMINHCTTADKLLIFDETGIISKLEVSKIPNMKPSEFGHPIERFVTLPGKKVVAVVLESADIPDVEEFDLVLLTEKGMMKKTSLSEFFKIRNSLMAINTDKNNELVSVISARKDTEKDVIIFTNQGNGIRLDLQDIKTFGRTAKGTQVLSLTGENEKVVGCNRIPTNNKYLLIVTSSGKVKLCDLKYFPVMKKKDEVLSLVNLDSREKIVGVTTVKQSDVITLYKKLSDPEILKVSDMKVSTRIAKATKVTKTSGGDAILAFQINQ